jgi:transposase
MKDNGFSLRLQMVLLARARGVSYAAREMKTSRLTVRKWLKRYQELHLQGLRDRPRIRRSQDRKISHALEEKIQALRRRYRWGPLRLKMQCGLPCGAGAIYRVIRQAGLIQKRIPKWKRKKDLRQQKKALAPFEKVQVDVKDLSDIPQYWPASSPERLPRYEYTARDVRTGAAFVAYAHANDGTSAAAFASYLAGHLANYGVELEDLRIQTDNGSEFIGNVNKKSLEPSAFEQILALANIRHERIPPARSTWNSDVETFHRTVEDELYSVEPLRTRAELLGKAYTYQLFYNHFRKNRWRDFQSPREILDSLLPGRYDPGVFSLPPLILDEVLTGPPPGNHVPESPNPLANTPCTLLGSLL